jgi:hypothetical protein
VDHRMKVRARFGPMPGDLSVQLGEDGFDVTQALCRVVFAQGLSAEEQRASQGRYRFGDYLPHITLELSIPYVEIEGDDVAVEVWIPEPTRAALVRLGWLDPERATEMQRRVRAVVEAAYAYVDLPDDVPHDPGLETPHPGQTLYEEMANAVELHRQYAREVQQP